MLTTMTQTFNCCNSHVRGDVERGCDTSSAECVYVCTWARVQLCKRGPHTDCRAVGVPVYHLFHTSRNTSLINANLTHITTFNNNYRPIAIIVIIIIPVFDKIFQIFVIWYRLQINY